MIWMISLPPNILDDFQVYYNEAMGLSPESKARGEKLVSGDSSDLTDVNFKI